MPKKKSRDRAKLSDSKSFHSGHKHETEAKHKHAHGNRSHEQHHHKETKGAASASRVGEGETEREGEGDREREGERAREGEGDSAALNAVKVSPHEEVIESSKGESSFMETLRSVKPLSSELEPDSIETVGGNGERERVFYAQVSAEEASKLSSLEENGKGERSITVEGEESDECEGVQQTELEEEREGVKEKESDPAEGESIASMMMNQVMETAQYLWKGEKSTKGVREDVDDSKTEKSPDSVKKPNEEANSFKENANWAEELEGKKKPEIVYGARKVKSEGGVETQQEKKSSSSPPNASPFKQSFTDSVRYKAYQLDSFDEEVQKRLQELKKGWQQRTPSMNVNPNLLDDIELSPIQPTMKPLPVVEMERAEGSEPKSVVKGGSEPQEKTKRPAPKPPVFVNPKRATGDKFLGFRDLTVFENYSGEIERVKSEASPSAGEMKEQEGNPFWENIYPKAVSEPLALQGDFGGGRGRGGEGESQATGKLSQRVVVKKEEEEEGAVGGEASNSTKQGKGNDEIVSEAPSRPEQSSLLGRLLYLLPCFWYFSCCRSVTTDD